MPLLAPEETPALVNVNVSADESAVFNADDTAAPPVGEAEVRVTVLLDKSVTSTSV